MVRYKRILNLTTALAIAVVGLATLTKADPCIWCNQEMSMNFMNCMCSEITNNPNFDPFKPGALEDMKNSMIAASTAITKSSDSMKMMMMNGAMAGELAELIKSQSRAANSVKAKSDMMEIVGKCYKQASGLQHYSFTQALGKTVSFMLNEQKEPSYDNSDSKTNSVPTQYPAQASESSAALSGQNNIAPNFYGASPQQQSFKQLELNNFAPNQRYIPPPPPPAPPKTSPGIISNYPNTELQQASASSVSLSGQNNIPSNTYGAPLQQQYFKQPVLNNFAPSQRYIPPPPPKTFPGVISNYPNTELQQASPSSVAFSWQNNKPPNFYGVPLQQQPFTPPVLNNFVPNQRYVPPPPKTPGVISNYRNTEFQYPVQLPGGQSETNAVSLTYSSNKQDNVPYNRQGPNVQPQRTQTNAVSSSDLFEQNETPILAPGTPIQQNNNAGGSSALFMFNPPNIRPDQFLPQNKGPVSYSAPSSAINGQRNLPNFITGPAIKLPDSVATSGTKAFAFKDQSVPPDYPQNQFVQYSNLMGGVLGQKEAYPLNVNNSPNKLDQSTASTSFIDLKPKNDYISKYPAPIVSYNKPQQNYKSPPITSYEEPQPNYDYESPPITPYEDPKPNNVNESSPVTSYKEPQPNYDNEYPPITSYEEPQPDYDNTSNNLVKPSSDNYQRNYDYYPNYPAQPSTYIYDYEPKYPDQPSSNNEPQPNYDDSKYPTPGISPGSSSSSSGSSVVTNDNTPDATSQRNGYPEDYSQPNNAAQPKRSKSRNKRPPAKAKSNDVTNQNSSPPSRKDDDVARAMRFAETVYVICSESGKFNSVFNRRISKKKASSYMFKALKGALKHCGYSEYSVPIAKACSVAIKSISGECTSIKYAETMSKSLMDKLYMKKLIGKNPEGQARSITIAFLARLKKKKSPGSSKLSKFTKLSSTSTALTSTVSPSTSDYVIYSDYSQDYSTYKEYGRDYPTYKDYRRYYPTYKDYGPNYLMNKDYGRDYPINEGYRRDYPKYSDYGKGDSPNPGIPNYQNYPTTPKVAVASGTSTSNPGENDGTSYAIDDDCLTTDSGYEDTNYSASTQTPDSQPKDDDQYYGDYPPYQVNKRPNEQSPGKTVSQTGPNTNTYPYYRYYDYYYNGDDKDDFSYQYYDNNPAPQTYERPNQRPPGNQAYPDYNKAPGSNVIQNDGFDERPRNTRTYFAHESSSSATKESKNDKVKNNENGRNKNRVTNNDSDINSGENQSDSNTEPGQYTTFPTYDTTTNQPQQNDFTDSTSNDEGGNFYPDTVPASAQAQTNPDNTKDEAKERVEVLMKWTLLSMSDGKFNYKTYSRVISALAKHVQKTHPEWSSQKCLLKVIMDAVIACTQLLVQVPEEYSANFRIPNDTDTAMANWSPNSSEKENQNSAQTDDKNVAQYDQSYATTQIPPQQNNRYSNYQSRQGNSSPLVQNTDTMQQRYGYGNWSPYSNVNAQQERQENWIPNGQQSGGGWQ